MKVYLCQAYPEMCILLLFFFNASCKNILAFDWLIAGVVFMYLHISNEF